MSINRIRKKHNLFLIEDCAHSIESKYNNIPLETLEVLAVLVFILQKNITTGEGGMIICNNKKLADKLKLLRLHGLSKDAWKRNLPAAVKFTDKFEHYDVKEVGLKYNLTDIKFSYWHYQLKKIEKIEKLEKIFTKYNKLLKGLPLKFQKIETDVKNFKHAYHLCIIKLDNYKNNKNLRDQLAVYLKNNKIGVGITYRSVTDMTIF